MRPIKMGEGDRSEGNRWHQTARYSAWVFGFSIVLLGYVGVSRAKFDFSQILASINSPRVGPITLPEAPIYAVYGTFAAVVVAALTFVVSVYFAWRRDIRETEQAKLMNEKTRLEVTALRQAGAPKVSPGKPRTQKKT
jgi:hypothetical protein